MYVISDRLFEPNIKNWSEKDELERKSKEKTDGSAVRRCFGGDGNGFGDVGNDSLGTAVSWYIRRCTEIISVLFDANQCGADDNVLTWRGKCHTYDAEASLSSAKGLSSSSVAAIKAANGGLDTVDVSGGYHDAGDHLKFSNTMGYSCTNLAWSYFENPDSYKETGSEDHLLYILKKCATTL